MHGILRIKDLAGYLTGYFEKLPEPSRIPRIVGIVFCQPSSYMSTSELRPSIEYFNYRSGEHVNFYFAGYYAEGNTWNFDPNDFNECRNEIQKACSKWRYSGGTDLILCNTKYDAKAKSAVLDYETAEYFVFENLKQTGEVPDLKMFFEEIFRYCEENFNSNKAVNPEIASVQHLRATLIKPPLRLNDGLAELASLYRKLEATCQKLTALNVETHNTIAKAEAVTEIFKEATQPLQEMYKDERLVKAKAEGIRSNIPELVLDRIVAEHLSSGFPAIDRFYKTLITSGDLNKLRKNRRGSSRSQIARHLKVFRKIMERKGLIEKRRAPHFVHTRSTEHYNPEFGKHQNTDGHSEPDGDGSNDPENNSFDEDDSENAE